MVTTPRIAARVTSAPRQPWASTSQPVSGVKTTLANPATTVSTASAWWRAWVNQVAITANAGS
jgi:hypothetical protein